MTQYLTVEQVADKLDLHWQTILKYIKEGKIQAKKVGKEYRITHQALDEFLDESNVSYKNISEIELRALLPNRKEVEDKVKERGGKLIQYIHLVDYWYCLKSRQSLQEVELEDQDAGSDWVLRIRKSVDPYSGDERYQLESKVPTVHASHHAFEEHATYFENFEEMQAILDAIELKCFFVIDKERFVYKLKDYTIAFDSIRDFGDGVELELKSDKSVTKVRKDLAKLAEELGIKKDNILEKTITYEAMQVLAQF